MITNFLRCNLNFFIYNILRTVSQHVSRREITTTIINKLQKETIMTSVSTTMTSVSATSSTVQQVAAPPQQKKAMPAVGSYHRIYKLYRTRTL